jgi:hypothetical protein
MAEVVCKGDSFGEVFVKLQGACNGARNLCDFDGMRQPGTEQVAFMVNEDLGFVFQAPEGRGMNYTITITLVF